MRIDAHVQVFARASAEFPRLLTDQMPAERAVPVEGLLGEMERHHIDGAILVQTGGAELEHHAYLRHCLKTHPNRFRGIALIPPTCDAPADHMDRLAAAGDILGFRLFDLGGPADPLAPIDVATFSTFPIWRRAAEKDYVLWLYPRARDAHLLPFLFDAFPQVRVVCNHLMVCPGEDKFSWDDKGRPRVEVEMPPQTRYSTMGLKIGRIPDNTRGIYPYENVCVHLSGQYAFSHESHPYRDLAEWHRNLLSTFGSARLLWASDFPWTSADPGYGSMVRVVDELLPGLRPRERSNIMGGTARSFLRFPLCA